MPQIELKITMDEQMNVRVEGPIDQRLLCFGMLELAKDAINENYRESLKKIVRPTGAELAFGAKTGGN